MARKDDHHIRIKNLRTNEEQGFLLTSGDKPFTIQGMDNTATRISEGEILYSDFTNSRVFAQSEWGDGLSKYRDPHLIYSTVYPTKKYGSSDSIIINPGEFTLGAKALVAENFPDPTLAINCMANGEASGVVYAGIKGKAQIWRSTDHGLTWSVYRDFSATYPNNTEISDILFFTTNGSFSVGGSNLGKGHKILTYLIHNPSTKTSYVGKEYIITSGGGIVGTNNTYSTCSGAFRGNGYSTMLSKYDLTVTTSNILTQVNAFVAYDSGSSRGYFNYKGYPFVPGQQILINGATYTIVDNQSSSTYTYFSGNAGTGTYDVIIKPRTDGYMFSGTGISIINTSGYTRMYGTLGSYFEYQGYKFYIVGATDWSNEMHISDFNFPSGSQFNSNGNYYYIYSPDNQIDLLLAGGTFTLNKIDPTISTSQWATSKFWLYQTTDVEVLYGIYNNSSSIFALLANRSTSIQAGFMMNGLYSMHLSVYKPIFQYIFSTSLPVGEFGTCGLNGVGDGKGYLATKMGNDEAGVSCNLKLVTIASTLGTAPVITNILTIGEQSMSSIYFYSNALWIASNLSGWIYYYNIASSTIYKLLRVPVIDDFQNTYIDSIIEYAGNIVVGYQAGPGIVAMDPNTLNPSGDIPIQSDILCSIDHEPSSLFRINKLLNTGNNLLIGTNDTTGELLYYNKGNVADIGYMESSIYGGYIANVEKLWTYGYIRTTPWSFNDGQKIGLEVSFDEGQTWQWCPNRKGKPFSSTNDWETDTLYFHEYNSKPDIYNNNNQLLFFFPYNTKSNTIKYRAWLKKGTTVRPVVNHVAIHFNLNYKQELLINYNISLKPRDELLDGISVDIWNNNTKLNFLKEIWQNQDMIELTHVDGKKYTCISFSDDRTPGQGFVLTSQNASSARQDKDNLEYNLLFTLKTIANYSEIL